MRRSGDGSHYKIREVGMFRKLMLAMATVVAILALTDASYAGGLFLTEIGTEDVALAGAGWAARAQDASTLFKNPAGMSLLEGNQFQGGLQALYFQRRVQRHQHAIWREWWRESSRRGTGSERLLCAQPQQGLQSRARRPVELRPRERNMTRAWPAATT